MATVTVFQQIIRGVHSLKPNFVPKHSPVNERDLKLLRDFVENHKNILVLTGAGISTESGIPDYRSEKVGLYARSNHRPIQYQEFVRSATTRRRYWARNYVGWPRFSSSQPNGTHEAIQQLQDVGKVSCIVTQNVDSLHTKAGSTNVIELHGSAYRVHCLQCGTFYDRHKIQTELEETNDTFENIQSAMRPDGDVEISQEMVDKFRPPFCESCGGILKPDIVFFGDNVPKERVEKVKSSVEECGGLLVLGSSLTVFSSYRIILQAVEESKEICVVNIGATRADHLVDLKISAKCGDALPQLLC